MPRTSFEPRPTASSQLVFPLDHFTSSITCCTKFVFNGLFNFFSKDKSPAHFLPFFLGCNYWLVCPFSTIVADIKLSTSIYYKVCEEKSREGTCPPHPPAFPPSPPNGSTTGCDLNREESVAVIGSGRLEKARKRREQ